MIMKTMIKIRLTIFAKLFLTIFLTATILAISIAVFMNWSFSTGFAAFHHSTEIKRAEKVAKKLEKAYATYNNWGFVSYSLKDWQRFIRNGNPPLHPKHQPASKHNEHVTPPRPHSKRKKPLRPQPFMDRMNLLSPTKQWIAGKKIHLNLVETSFLTHIKIKHNNKTVGLLTIRQGTKVFEPIAENFLQQQLRNGYYVVIFAILIALLATLVLVRHFIRPVKALSQSTEKLSAGQLNTRITINSNDEFADLANDFNQLAKTLEKNEIQRRQWLVDISHELRTPIAVLQSEIEAILDGIRKPTEERILSLHHDVLALSKLVNDLYQLSLSDSHETRMEKRMLNLYEVATAATQASEALLQKKHLELVLKANETEVWIEGDEKLLYQLFSNLLENSSRYTDEHGKVVVTLQIKNNIAEICVADSAPSVPNESLPFLFDRLYRVEQSRNRSLGGSGLGLAICENIVNAHQGTIQAEQSTLEGLLIRMHLPLASAKEDE